ncbi:hypothetical protein AtNW77_Chr1g0002411 [Arabidopsis thaliana]|uniref:Uncharacterized protein n=2 Tax=Arabidopsis TaxID=3701 RepID=A0A178WCS8_ARATH|nr:hypothetical protein ISN45_At01g002270 [Arabidopsis thaliana x Arabidopsis arenosa]OAP14842.1 hypothetical protein AXX17_AT1G02340 [Arabidopsis thaliana]CAA0159538.1 unnamed protein product [Arabidopsis thaliana]
MYGFHFHTKTLDPSDLRQLMLPASKVWLTTHFHLKFRFPFAAYKNIQRFTYIIKGGLLQSLHLIS